MVVIAEPGCEILGNSLWIYNYYLYKCKLQHNLYSVFVVVVVKPEYYKYTMFTIHIYSHILLIWEKCVWNEKHSVTIDCLREWRAGCKGSRSSLFTCVAVAEWTLWMELLSEPDLPLIFEYQTQGWMCASLPVKSSCQTIFEPSLRAFVFGHSSCLGHQIG